MIDRIAKQRLNVILLVDCSTSMRGVRISQVNQALRDVQTHLSEMQKENSNVDFYLTVITFSTEARFLNDEKFKNVDQFDFKDIWAGGWSNLHLAYDKLDEVLAKESKGGIMPDFGGLAPIVLLLTDGHPTGAEYKESLETLKKRAWFKVALRYGIAIELKDERTMQVLQEFVGDNGQVIDCFDAKMLQNIIKVIVLTASKVKSSGSSIHQQNNKQNVQQSIQQNIQQALNETEENWEW